MNEQDLREGVKWEMGKAYRSGTDADGISAAVIAYIRQHDGHADLQERLDTAERALLAHGYRKSCGIPACNCGDQWNHGGYAMTRLSEIESTTADYYRNGEILLERIERVVAIADGHAEFVRAVRELAANVESCTLPYTEAERLSLNIIALCDAEWRRSNHDPR